MDKSLAIYQLKLLLFFIMLVSHWLLKVAQVLSQYEQLIHLIAIVFI